ncbi:hypothetical protein N665_0317s0012 [Sinapis alba]|nr:hypothetical protein N665_0317s0012 [Sinapis alba]
MLIRRWWNARTRWSKPSRRRLHSRARPRRRSLHPMRWWRTSHHPTRRRSHRWSLPIRRRRSSKLRRWPHTVIRRRTLRNTSPHRRRRTTEIRRRWKHLSRRSHHRRTRDLRLHHTRRRPTNSTNRPSKPRLGLNERTSRYSTSCSTPDSRTSNNTS